MVRRLCDFARRHRLELLIAVCVIAALFAVSQSTRTTARAFERGESWRHATGALSAEVARSHVWLEELTGGDRSVDVQAEIIAPLDTAGALCAGLRSGGFASSGRLEPVAGASRPRVVALCDTLARLEAITRERIITPDSGAGTAIDARFDVTFRRASLQADRLGDELAGAVRAERERARRLDAGLIAGLLALFALMGLLGRRHVRERLALQRLEALALRDPLTGLANHRHFHERLRDELLRARRDGSATALILLDLDHFGGLNDSRGHTFGDRVLTEVAAAMGGAVRESDLVGRVGGATFAVLLPGARMPAAVAAADALRARIARLRPGGVEVTASAGIARFPADAPDAPGLLEAAGGALDWAKRDGRDRTRRYDPEHVRTSSMRQQRQEILAMLARDGALRPVFQPLVALDSGAVAGFEALTLFGGIAGGPERWFDQARRCGLAGALEARAMTLALGSPDRPAGAFVSVNVSPSGLLGEAVMEALPDDLRDVVVELTEHEAADAPDLAGRLDELRRRGARIAVDDAGAGHAGLQQVMRVRPDIIKLDRGLVDGVAGDPARAALIECFVAFARRVDATVCAEGIESREDLRVLAALGVHYGQGYGLARPAPEWSGVSPEAWRILRGDRAGRAVAP
jgi:diguanylate cyclase (GGDEF)-like protein